MSWIERYSQQQAERQARPQLSPGWQRWRQRHEIADGPNGGLVLPDQQLEAKKVSDQIAFRRRVERHGLEHVTKGTSGVELDPDD